MSLFGEKICTDCNSSTKMLMRIRLADDQYLCSKCADIIPKYMNNAVKNYYTNNDFQAFKVIWNTSENELKAQFKETHYYGELHIDIEHGMFYIGSSLKGKTLVLNFADINDFDFEFIPEEYKEGLLGNKVVGKVIFKIAMNNPEFIYETILDARAYGKAKKSFFGNKITFTHPDKMLNFEENFIRAVIMYQQEEQSSQNNMNRSDLDKAMSLFMIDDILGTSIEEVKAQRNRLIKSFHPDSNTQIDDKYSQKINEAYHLLINQLKEKN